MDRSVAHFCCGCFIVRKITGLSCALVVINDYKKLYYYSLQLYNQRISYFSKSQRINMFNTKHYLREFFLISNRLT